MRHQGRCGLIGIVAVVLLLAPGGRTQAQEKWGSKEDKIELTRVVYSAENAPERPELEDLPLRKSLSQYGITWTFDREVRAGRFITGDWYFVGPASVVEIEPKPLFGKEVPDAGRELVNQGRMKEADFKNKWCRNGSTLNEPTPGPRQGYDSRMPNGEYDPSEVAHLPVAMKPGDALISSISNPNERLAESRFSGHSRVLKSMAVLTCLAEPLPTDAFRPSYGDREQRIYLARNLRRELLYSLPKPKSVPMPEEWIRRVHRPWIDIDQWNHATAEENQPRYGQWYTWTCSIVSLMLHLDYEPEEKEALLVPFVQRGIDLWGIVRAGHPGWLGHGGFGGGRKWHIIFAGIMLGSEDMMHVKRDFPDVMFGEDTQTARGRSWNGYDVVFTSHPIRIKQGAWKISPDAQPPEQWPAMSNEGYRRCCTSRVWPGQALAIRLMRAEKLWNHDPWLAYVDRWMVEDHIGDMRRIAEGLRKNTAMSPQARRHANPERYEQDADRWEKRGYRLTDGFPLEMWKAYRHNLPPAKERED